MMITLIAAIAQNGVIGQGDALPFRLKTDMKHFKRVTMGKPVLMGRKTFASIGRPLPNRRNIVITRQKDWLHQGVEIASSLYDALDLVKDDGEVCIIGGGQIYAQAISLADKLIITHVQCQVAGDVYFPLIEAEQWHISAKEYVKASTEDDADMEFVTYNR